MDTIGPILQIQILRFRVATRLVKIQRSLRKVSSIYPRSGEKETWSGGIGHGKVTFRTPGPAECLRTLGVGPRNQEAPHLHSILEPRGSQRWLLVPSAASVQGGGEPQVALSPSLRSPEHRAGSLHPFPTKRLSSFARLFLSLGLLLLSFGFTFSLQETLFAASK